MVSYRAGNADTPADVLVGAEEDEQMHRRATAVYDFYRSGHRALATDQGSQPRSPNPDLRFDASPSAHYSLPTTRSFPSPTYTDVPGAEHELWHPNYLQAIKTALDRLVTQPS